MPGPLRLLHKLMTVVEQCLVRRERPGRAGFDLQRQFRRGLCQQAAEPIGAVFRHLDPVADAVERLVLWAIEQGGRALVGPRAVVLEYSLEQGLLVTERAIKAALAEAC